MDRLREYFSNGLSTNGCLSVGMEVETSFVTVQGRPATVVQSQAVFQRLLGAGWTVAARRGQLTAEIVDSLGNRVLYELGRQNIEVSSAPATAGSVVQRTTAVLGRLYEAAGKESLRPRFAPILEIDEDLLVIPDERDATWLALDGRAALVPLARISAVQFTISVPPEKAVVVLNRLGEQIGQFLRDYPQESVWRRYIAESLAGYHPLRYGGPLMFTDLDDYCRELCRHDVIKNSALVPYAQVAPVDIPLYLRSIWWYFRLRRYGDRLCIEVRPLARREDVQFERQLTFVLDTMQL